jgi:hypothetical protein
LDRQRSLELISRGGNFNHRKSGIRIDNVGAHLCANQAHRSQSLSIHFPSRSRAIEFRMKPPCHQPPAAAAGNRPGFNLAPPGGRDPETAHVGAAKHPLRIRARQPCRATSSAARGRDLNDLVRQQRGAITVPVSAALQAF